MTEAGQTPPARSSSPASFTGTARAATPTVFAWGCGEDGQLGVACAPVLVDTASPDYAIDAPRAIETLDGVDVVGVVSGSRNSLATTRDGALYAWGWNSHRTLGYDWRDRDELYVKMPDRVRMEIDDGGKVCVRHAALGGWHAVCVDFNGDVWAWGGNEHNQIGVTRTNDDACDGDVPNRDWAEVRSMVSPGRRVALPTAMREVTCGGMSSFALSVDGRVFEWGQTTEDDEPHAEPKQLKCDKHVLEIAAGSFHLLLRTRGEVLSYGNGMYGQLGLGATGASAEPCVIETFGIGFAPKSIAAGGWHSACVTAGGLLYTWGRGEYGRLGLGDDCKDKVTPQVVNLGNGEETFVDAVSLGGSHSVALTSEGHVLSWGRNTLGRLGRVVRDPSPACGFPGRVIFPPLPGGAQWRVSEISAGGRHTLALATKTLPSSTVA